MATEAEKSTVDQGHTAESVHAPPPAPAAAAAVAPPALFATVAASTIPGPLAPAPPPSLPFPREVPVSGASAPIAMQTHVVQPPVQVAVGGPARGKAVGAGPSSAHLVTPAAAPVQPVAQRHAESQSHGAAGGNAAAHRGRGSPRHRPSSSYRSAHRGGRGGWWGGRGRGRGGPSEMQQPREDFPEMLAAAMRAALTGAPNLESSLAPATAAHAPAPVHARALPTPHMALAPNDQAYSQVRAPAADRAPPASARPVSAAPCPPLPWIPPVSGTGFVGAGGGEARGAFVPPRSTLGHHARADCLTAAAQFAFLQLPVLAAPATGGVAVSQLDETVQDLTGHLREGGAVVTVGATALVVRQLWRTMRGILAALDAHLM
ncbi:unnamed protein product [Closterium sp. Naga37s-1]|nr:unnamed protein product [Closterium sp. Naga37s-1]